MTFTQINYFLTIGKYLNFTQAAAELFVTQSTLSRSIAALETELGVTLFERDFHNVQLTPAGEVMFKEMQDIMTMIDALIKRVRATADIVSSKFAIGILEGQQVDSKILLTLRNLSDKYPQFSMDLKRMGHDELVQQIKANKLDIAETVITKDTVLDEEIDYLPIREVENYLIARKDDQIWQQGKPGLASIDGKVMVVSDKPNPGSDGLRKIIEQAGIHPIYKEASDMETHALWLEAGMGVAVCNENNIIYSSRAFRPIESVRLDELEKVAIALIWNKGYPSPMVDQFLMFIKSGMSDE